VPTGARFDVLLCAGAAATPSIFSYLQMVLFPIRVFPNFADQIVYGTVRPKLGSV